MQFRTLFAAIAATLTFSTDAMADRGHAHGEERAYGLPGDPKKPSRIVLVMMREADEGKMLFVPKRIQVRTGEQVKFVLRNNGQVDHEMVIGTLAENLKHAKEMQKNPEMEHDDPNAKRVGPGKTGEIVRKFTKAGEFDFSCLIPGHRESGMFGTLIVRTEPEDRQLEHQ